MKRWLLLLLVTQVLSCFQDIDQDGVSGSEDCHDGDSTVYPGHPEICDDLPYAGKSISSLGDLDGDGRSELALGVDGEGGEPDSVQIVTAAGMDTILRPVGQVIGAGGVEFGNDVDGSQDFDRDGRQDLLIAGCRADREAVTYLLFEVAPGTHITGEAGTTLVSSQATTCDEMSVRSVGSFDGDLYPEAITAMPRWHDSTVQIGLVTLLAGYGP